MKHPPPPSLDSRLLALLTLVIGLQFGGALLLDLWVA
jgi:hypothetical protein